MGSPGPVLRHPYEEGSAEVDHKMVKQSGARGPSKIPVAFANVLHVMVENSQVTCDRLVAVSSDENVERKRSTLWLPSLLPSSCLRQLAKERSIFVLCKIHGAQSRKLKSILRMRNLPSRMNHTGKCRGRSRTCGG